MSVLACEDIAREKLEYDKLPHNDALVFDGIGVDGTTKCRTNDTMPLNGISIVKWTVGLTIKWYRPVYQFPTKGRTYDTLVLTTVLIVLNKVGLTIHWS